MSTETIGQIAGGQLPDADFTDSAKVEIERADGTSFYTTLSKLRDLLPKTAPFTPAVVGITVAGTTTPTVQIGTATKIGPRVFFTLRVAWSNMTGTGGILVTGLPYTAANNGLNTPCIIIASGLTFSGAVAAQVNANSSTIEIVQIVSNTALADVAVDTTGDLRISGSYEV